MNVRTKFEVRIFTHSWDNTDIQKIWAVPGYAHAPLSPKFFMDFCSDIPCECIGPYVILIHQRHRRTDRRTDDMQSQYRDLH